MFKSKVFVIFAVSALLLSALAPAVMAGALTQPSQVQWLSRGAGTPFDPYGLNPPLDDVTQIVFAAGSSRVFTNSTAIVAGLATDLRSVGILAVNDTVYQGSSVFNSPRYPVGLAENRIYAVFGVQGRVVGVNEGAFTEGKVGFYYLPGGNSANINPDDPTTWDIVDDLVLITEYVLAQQFNRTGTDVPIAGPALDGPRDEVGPGPFGQNLFFPEADVDRSGVNTAIGAAGAGQFVFIENPKKPNDPLIDTSYTDSHGLDAGEVVLPTGPGFPVETIPTGQVDENGLPLYREGLAIKTEQQLSAVQSPLTALQLASLNKIALWAFGDVFATGLGAGPDTNFNPLITNGDFRAQLGGFAVPIAFTQIVPEPTTFTVWAVGAGIMGLFARRRRLMARSA